jgi:hypothetical protein
MTASSVVEVDDPGSGLEPSLGSSAEMLPVNVFKSDDQVERFYGSVVQS